jgi:hypothetical protein
MRPPSGPHVAGQMLDAVIRARLHPARMPLAFPSHQGLIAPVWRRWPRHFTVLGCAIGAAVPDVVDGAIGLARGELGQGIGHSLLGLFVLCVPVGMALDAATVAAARAVSRSSRRWSALAASHVIRWSVTDGGETRAPSARLFAGACSVWLGALSHLVFDFVSHGNFLWLHPWYDGAEIFPAWWHARWLEIPFPGYTEPYPVGPHFAVWMVLNVVGAVLFFLPWWRADRRRRATRASDSAERDA